MGAVYFWTGAAVIWGLSAAIVLLALYIIPWRFTGYIVGWFRLARLSRVSPWHWAMFRWAWKHTIGLEDGWFQEQECGRVPLYGFAKIEADTFYGA